MKHFLLMLSASTALLAQQEFVVNTTLRGVQRNPQIARDAGGNYAVVWKSEAQVDSTSRGDIFLRFFDAHDAPLSGEMLVNTVTKGDQDKPAIAMNSSGDLVVVWASFTGFESLYDIRGRMFKNRSPAAEEFAVNTTTLHTQTNPAVAIDEVGNFVVVWDSWYQDGSDRGVYGRRFASTGQPLGGEFLINQTTAFSQARPSVKLMNNGRLIVAWESWKQDIATPSGYGLYGRIFSSTGEPTGNEFRLNTYTNDYQWFGDVEVFDDNSFVVAWCSWGQDGDQGGIYLQRFDPSGNRVGMETRVNQTTVFYQWLPKVRKFADQTFAVVWSSWKQDGDREGVFARTFDAFGNSLSFETQMNEYMHSFQWEPDFVTADNNEILAVWASWGQTGENDYDIVARRLKAVRPQGFVERTVMEHVAGRATAKIIAHVVDSSALAGHTYEIGFDSLSPAGVAAWVRSLSSGDTLVRRYALDRGANAFYITPVFHGLAVEFRPDFEFALDAERSSFVNNSGSTMIFQVGLPINIGSPRLAPIDIALIWGSSDTLADGRYAQPLDTAINLNNQRIVLVPFRARNLTDGQKVELLIDERATTGNQRFDPGERIVLLTPLPYRMAANNTHAQIATTRPAENFIRPSVGDTVYVFTRRPLTGEDRFRFSPANAVVLDVADENPWLRPQFALQQNYPNPFNPTTTIRYTVPERGRVEMILYNVLGQKIRTIVNEVQEAGEYRVLMDGSELASGVYLYTLRTNSGVLTRRMVLVK